jgi:biopolymer transport protein ExbD
MSAPKTRGAIGLGGLTPLLDTLFILIFALLALSDTRSAERAETVRIQLPAVEPGGDESSQLSRRIEFEITADSILRVAGMDSVLDSRADVDSALARVLAEPDPSGVVETLPELVLVVIRADRDSRHGVAVELLQHLRLRGFVNVELIATGDATGGAFGGLER